MKFEKLNDNYLVKLEKGEEIIKTLTQFCEDNNIKSGTVAGIGGADDITLKYYDPEKKEYLSKNFNGKNYEIISLNGNISLLDEKPFLHLHAIIGDSDYRTFGGHLAMATIAITGEIIINLADKAINRKMDNEFKLNLLDL
jgi:hypothetical protein